MFSKTVSKHSQTYTNTRNRSKRNSDEECSLNCFVFVKEPFFRNSSSLRNIFIHRFPKPLWMKSVLLHHYYAYKVKCWSLASGKSHLYIHTNHLPAPMAYETRDFLLDSNQQQKRAEHGHISFISSQNHCYHGKKMLFFPLSTDIWNPSPERAGQFTLM